MTTRSKLTLDELLKETQLPEARQQELPARSPQERGLLNFSSFSGLEDSRLDLGRFCRVRTKISGSNTPQQVFAISSKDLWTGNSIDSHDEDVSKSQSSSNATRHSSGLLFRHVRKSSNKLTADDPVPIIGKKGKRWRLNKTKRLQDVSTPISPITSNILTPRRRFFGLSLRSKGSNEASGKTLSIEQPLSNKSSKIDSVFHKHSSGSLANVTSRTSNASTTRNSSLCAIPSNCSSMLPPDERCEKHAQIVLPRKGGDKCSFESREDVVRKPKTGQFLGKGITKASNSLRPLKNLESLNGSEEMIAGKSIVLNDYNLKGTSKCIGPRGKLEAEANENINVKVNSAYKTYDEMEEHGGSEETCDNPNRSQHRVDVESVTICDTVEVERRSLMMNEVHGIGKRASSDGAALLDRRPSAELGLRANTFVPVRSITRVPRHCANIFGKKKECCGASGEDFRTHAVDSVEKGSSKGYSTTRRCENQNALLSKLHMRSKPYKLGSLEEVEYSSLRKLVKKMNKFPMKDPIRPVCTHADGKTEELGWDTELAKHITGIKTSRSLNDFLTEHHRQRIPEVRNVHVVRETDKMQKILDALGRVKTRAFSRASSAADRG